MESDGAFRNLGCAAAEHFRTKGRWIGRRRRAGFWWDPARDSECIHGQFMVFNTAVAPAFALEGKKYIGKSINEWGSI